MKDPNQLTFAEALEYRAALLQIVQVLEHYGLVKLSDPEPPKNKPPKAAPKKKATPKKITRHRRKGGHKEKCFNPGCKRGPGKTPRTYIRRKTTQRFCHLECGQHFFTTIRSYARALVRANEEKANEWRKANPWLTGKRAEDDVARIIKLESNLWRKEQDRIAKRKKAQQRGETIVKNTPTASSTTAH